MNGRWWPRGSIVVMAESRELKLNRGRGRREICCWREAGIHDRKTEYSQACTVCRAVLQDSNKKKAADWRRAVKDTVFFRLCHGFGHTQTCAHSSNCLPVNVCVPVGAGPLLKTCMI